eukprot:2332235-Rhodomonas_salina.2
MRGRDLGVRGRDSEIVSLHEKLTREIASYKAKPPPESDRVLAERGMSAFGRCVSALNRTARPRLALNRTARSRPVPSAPHGVPPSHTPRPRP